MSEILLLMGKIGPSSRELEGGRVMGRLLLSGPGSLSASDFLATGKLVLRDGRLPV